MKNFLKYFIFICYFNIIYFIDGLYEFLKINNLFGLKLEASRGSEDYYLTGFFDNEKLEVFNKNTSIHN